MGHQLWIEVESDDQLHLRGVGAAKSHQFVADTAGDICQAFAEIMEFEHRFRSAAERTVRHSLEAIDERMRREILSADQVLLFDKQCATHKNQLEIWMKGPSAFVNLPFEALRHDGRCLDYYNVSLARTTLNTDKECSRPQGEKQNRLRVLLVPAQPSDQGKIQWENLHFELESHLWHFRSMGLIDWVVLGNASDYGTWNRLHRTMAQQGHDHQPQPFDLVVFLAHGRCYPRPQIALVGSDGGSDWKTVDEMIPVLTCGALLPRMVVLACCHLAKVDLNNPFGGFAYQLIEQGIPAVLSMQSAVSTEGASAAVAALCRSVVQELPIGKAILECRRSMGKESLLPSLWLHPDFRQGEPLVRLAALPIDELLLQAQHEMAGRLLPQTVEVQLAALRYLEDTHPGGVDLQIKSFYVERHLGHIRENIRKARLAENRDVAAREILLLHHRCKEIVGPSTRGLKTETDWIEEPLRILVRQAKECEASSDWELAIELYQRALDKHNEGYYVERLWQRLRSEAQRRQQYARGQQLLRQAHVARQRKELETAQSLKEQAICQLHELFEHFPTDFRELESFLTSLRRETKIEKLLVDTHRLIQEGKWNAAAEILPTAMVDGSDEAITDEIQIIREGARLEGSFHNACEQAGQRKWDEAVAILEGLTPRFADPRLQIWWERLQTTALAKTWRAASTVEFHLRALQTGVQITPADDDASPLRELFHVQPLDRVRVEHALNHFQPRSPIDLGGQVGALLAADAVGYHALTGDWNCAWDALGALREDESKYWDACHVLAVIALDRAIKEDFALTKDDSAWKETLAAWMIVLVHPAYWSRWLEKHTIILPHERPVTGLLDWLRRQLTGWLGQRQNPAPLLRQCAAMRTFAPEEFGELTILGLELAEKYLRAGDWDAAEDLWKTSLKLASVANRLHSTCIRIFELGLPDSDLRNAKPETIADRLRLFEVLHRVLAGTEKERDAAQIFSSVLTEHGLEFLKQNDDRTAILAANVVFERAYNLCPDVVSTACLALVQVLLTRVEVAPAEKQRLLEIAHFVVKDGLRRWPDDSLLLTAKEFVEGQSGTTDRRHERFLQALTRRQRQSASCNWEDRIRIAQEQGFSEDAVVFLLDSLRQGEKIPRVLAQDTFLSWLAPLFSPKGSGDDIPRLDVALSRLGDVLEHYEGDATLSELRRKLEVLQTYLRETATNSNEGRERRRPGIPPADVD